MANPAIIIVCATLPLAVKWVVAATGIILVSPKYIDEYKQLRC